MSQRQLAAIMFTDFVAYSALTQRNESLALELLEKHWALLRPIIKKFDGREIKTMGDAFLIEFQSALQAVEAGLAMQGMLGEYNSRVDTDRAIHIRIGIHSGDIERRGDDVFGDGVNIAARLEPLARPDGVCISEPVYASVSNKLDVPFYPMGAQRLKNISQTIAVYSNHPDDNTGFIKSRRNVLILWMTMATVMAILAILTFAWIKDGSPVLVTTGTETKTEEAIEPTVVTDRKSVAVLPFVNRSRSEDDAYFADGLHDDLLTHLSKITDMKVISRTSVMGYRDTQKNMKTIGGELGVATLLEGSVQRAENQVRINVQLIDVNTDEHIWAEIYDRKLTAANIFAIQTEIATAIANALRATLSPEEQKRIAAIPTENIAAYEAYLLGKQRMVIRNSDKLAEAVDYFEQAIALDPAFALAYVGLSDATQLQFLYSGLAADERTAKAEGAIHKALLLDENLGEAYASLGLLKLERKDYDGAEIAFKKALALNPNYATSYQWYGSLLSDLGRSKEASVQMQKALALDPLSIVINTNVAFYHIISGRFDQAMAQFERIIEIDPSASQGYIGKARLYWAVYGQLDQAAPWFRKALALDPNSPQYNAILGGLYLTLGDDKQAECWVNKALTLGPESILPNLLQFYIHAYRNEMDQALASARIALKINPGNQDALAILRDHDLLTGNYERARALYKKSYPALLRDGEATIDRTNYTVAIDLAYVLQLVGEQERADRLLEGSLSFIRSGIHMLDFDGYKLADVQIYALRGEKQKALTTLRQTVDKGWTVGWWYYLTRDPILESIRNEPEFQQILAEIQADMAGQLARVKATEKEGDVCVNH